MSKHQVGDKVTYVNHKCEKGIVKEVVDENNVRVVYHCGEDWEHYFDYTSALTSVKHLVSGWRESYSVFDELSEMLEM